MGSEQQQREASRPRLRVVNIIEEARLGGPQIRISNVAGRLRDFGVETIVYTAGENSAAFSDHLADNGTALRTFRLVRLQSGLLRQLSYLLSTPATVWQFRKALLEDRPDIVHVNSAAQWRGAAAARLAGVPCIWHLNDTNMPRIVNALFGRMMHRLADAFIVAGERVRSYYLTGRENGRSITSIPAPVDTARFRPGKVIPDAEISAIPGIKVANVGHVNPDKDIGTLLRTARLVQESAGNEIVFVQVGGRHENQATYCLAMDGLADELQLTNLRFLGPRRDVPEILAACDLYFCSSRSEASPTSVWEALAAGLPVVSTDVGDVAALNDEYGFGIVGPVGDDAALARAIRTLSGRDRPDLRNRDRLHELSGKLFSLKKVAALHLGIYRETTRTGEKAKLRG